MGTACATAWRVAAMEFLLGVAAGGRRADRTGTRTGHVVRIIDPGARGPGRRRSARRLLLPVSYTIYSRARHHVRHLPTPPDPWTPTRRASGRRARALARQGGARGHPRPHPAPGSSPRARASTSPTWPSAWASRACRCARRCASWRPRGSWSRARTWASSCANSRRRRWPTSTSCARCSTATPGLRAGALAEAPRRALSRTLQAATAAMRKAARRRDLAALLRREPALPLGHRGGGRQRQARRGLPRHRPAAAPVAPEEPVPARRHGRLDRRARGDRQGRARGRLRARRPAPRRPRGRGPKNDSNPNSGGEEHHETTPCTALPAPSSRSPRCSPASRPRRTTRPRP